MLMRAGQRRNTCLGVPASPGILGSGPRCTADCYCLHCREGACPTLCRHWVEMVQWPALNWRTSTAACPSPPATGGGRRAPISRRYHPAGQAWMVRARASLAAARCAVLTSTDAVVWPGSWPPWRWRRPARCSRDRSVRAPTAGRSGGHPPTILRVFSRCRCPAGSSGPLGLLAVRPGRTGSRCTLRWGPRRVPGSQAGSSGQSGGRASRRGSWSRCFRPARHPIFPPGSGRCRRHAGQYCHTFCLARPLFSQPLLLVLPSTEGVCDSGPAACGVRKRGEVRPERGELGRSERGQMAPKGRADLCFDSTCSRLVGQLLIPHREGMREPKSGLWGKGHNRASVTTSRLNKVARDFLNSTFLYWRLIYCLILARCEPTYELK